MATIGERIKTEIISTLYTSPTAGCTGALLGYVYAKLANLPVAANTKAWAIWNVAERALLALPWMITEKPKARTLLSVTILIASTTIGIQEMRKRGLMGDKLMYLVIAFKALRILLILSSADEDLFTNEPIDEAADEAANEPADEAADSH
jgi:hypothetical protein